MQVRGGFRTKVPIARHRTLPSMQLCVSHGRCLQSLASRCSTTNLSVANIGTKSSRPVKSFSFTPTKTRVRRFNIAISCVSLCRRRFCIFRITAADAGAERRGNERHALGARAARARRTLAAAAGQSVVIQRFVGSRCRA